MTIKRILILLNVISLLPCFNQHLNPYADVLAVVVIRPSADEVAIHYTGLVNESPAAHFEIKFAFGHGRHFPALHASGVSWYFHTVANACDGLIRLEKMPRDTDKVLIIAYVFRCPAAREKYADIFLGPDVLKSNIRSQCVALELPRDLPVPVGRYLVHDHVISPLFRPGHDRLETIFLQAIVRIQRIDRLGGVTNYYKYLIHFASNIKLPHAVVNKVRNLNHE